MEDASHPHGRLSVQLQEVVLVTDTNTGERPFRVSLEFESRYNPPVKDVEPPNLPSANGKKDKTKGKGTETPSTSLFQITRPDVNTNLPLVSQFGWHGDTTKGLFLEGNHSASSEMERWMSEEWHDSRPIEPSETESEPVTEDTFLLVKRVLDASVHSKFLRLDVPTIQRLCQSSVIVRVYSEKPMDIPSTKPVRGKETTPLETAPEEELMMEFAIPMVKLIAENWSSLSFSLAFQAFSFNPSMKDLEEKVPSIPMSTLRYQHESLNLPHCMLRGEITFDESLLEFLYNSRVIHWNQVEFSSLPTSWTLQAPDVIDSKAKVPQSTEQLRMKYLETIQLLLPSQEALARYELRISPMNAGEDQKSEQSWLPPLWFQTGKVHFDETRVEEVNQEIDLRSPESGLWSLSFGSSEYAFLHRHALRLLATTTNHQEMKMRVELFKTPLVETEGSDVLHSISVMDCSKVFELEQTDIMTEFTFEFSNDKEEEEVPLIHASLNLSSPFPHMIIPKSFTPPNEKMLPSTISLIGTNEEISALLQDPLQRLREEFVSILRILAKEFSDLSLQLMPSSPLPSTKTPRTSRSKGLNTTRSTSSENSMISSVGIGNPPPSQAIDLVAFMEFLQTRGVLSDLTKRLHDEIIRVINEIHSKPLKTKRPQSQSRNSSFRSLSAGSSSQFLHNNNDNNSNTQESVSVSKIVTSAYDFLTREITAVFNSLQAKVRFDRLSSAVNASNYNSAIDSGIISGIAKTPSATTNTRTTKQLIQELDNLLSLACSNEEDGKFSPADKFHTRRLNLLDENDSLRQNHQLVSTIYRQYGEFLLRWAVETIHSAPLESPSSREGVTAKTKSTYTSILIQALQALETASAAQLGTLNTLPGASSEPQPGLLPDVELTLLIVATHIECGALTQAETVLLHAVHQWETATVHGSLSSWIDLSGYDSEGGGIVALHPRILLLMSSLFHLQQRPLLVRKTLRLLPLSFQAYQPQTIESDNGDIESKPSSTSLWSSLTNDFLMTIGAQFYDQPISLRIVLLTEMARQAQKFAHFRLAHAAIVLAHEEHSRGLELLMMYDSLPSFPSVVSFSLRYATAMTAYGPCPLISIQDALGVIETCQRLATTPREHVFIYQLASQLNKRMSLIEEAHDFSMRAILADAEMYTNSQSGIRLSKTTLPLHFFLNTAKSFISFNSFDEAYNILELSAALYPNISAPLIYQSVVDLRLGKLQSCETSLSFANAMNPFDGEVWALLTLCLLKQGIYRLEEAEACLFQALRCQCANVDLWLELAQAFLTADLPRTADRVIRRAMQLQRTETQYDRDAKSLLITPTAAKAMTEDDLAITPSVRQQFGIILLAQNYISEAIEQYRLVLADARTPDTIKLMVAEECYRLLQDLGREEELSTLGIILDELYAANTNVYSPLRTTYGEDKSIESGESFGFHVGATLDEPSVEL